ncbi:MAG: hypothetical protein PUD52_02295, partial [Prevotella sp.]|nr:hypothetical protein [Prevotella sp.]
CQTFVEIKSIIILARNNFTASFVDIASFAILLNHSQTFAEITGFIILARNNLTTSLVDIAAFTRLYN